MKNLPVEFWSFWAEKYLQKKKKTCGPEGLTKVLKRIRYLKSANYNLKFIATSMAILIIFNYIA